MKRRRFVRLALIALALIVVGLFTIFDGLMECIVLPNIKRLVENIRNGAFDFTLLKPINSQFLSTLRYARLHGLTDLAAVSYTHLRAHETVLDLVCRLLLAKKNQQTTQPAQTAPPN